MAQSKTPRQIGPRLQKPANAARMGKKDAKSAETIKARQRQEQALTLRQTGVSYAQIAQQLGYASASGAHFAVQEAIKRLSIEPAKDLVRVELARLDQMQALAWREMLNGDLNQIDRILRIMERRSRYTGLDQAVESGTVNVTVEANGKVAVHQEGVLVINGSHESEYVRGLAEAMGMTPEQVAAMKPSEAEDPKVVVERLDAEVTASLDNVVEGELIEEED